MSTTMLKFVSILSWVWLALAGIVPASDATAARRHVLLSDMPLESAQSPGNIEIAIDKADPGPAEPHPNKKAEDSDADIVIVGDIHFTVEKGGTEKVCFLLNRFCNPLIFSLEGSKPRIVIDIKNVSSWTGKSRMPVKGILIRQVRSYFHRDHNKLRIVMDLAPSMDYVAEPLYYESKGVFCIAVGVK